MSSLSRKFLAPNVLLAVLIAAALGQVAYEATVRASAARMRVDEVVMTNGYLVELNQLVSEIQRNALAYQVRPDERFLAPIGPLYSEVHRIIEVVGRTPIPPRGAELWRELVATQELLEEADKDLFAARRAGPVDRMEPVFAEWNLLAEQREALLADFTTYNVTRLDQTIAAFAERRATWLLMLGSVIACSVVLVVVSSVNLRRTVLRPLASMTAAADRFATEPAGTLVSGAERADEIGVLARAFNRMTMHLVDANRKLAESVRARDEFLSIASHELKTPLSSLKLQLQLEGRHLAAEAPRVNGGQPKWLDASLRQVERLERLIGSLLDVTRMRAGRFETRPQQVDLAELVESVVERFSADLGKSQTVARLELERGTIGRWDPERLDQVVTNLLANVVKYAPGAPVEVAVAKRGGYGVLTVRDHGPGLTGDLRERAFDPFERASTSRGIGGLGLGLYIAKGIVAAHGGTITVDSQPGAGAEFIVKLPLSVPEQPEGIAARPSSTGRSRTDQGG